MKDAKVSVSTLIHCEPSAAFNAFVEPATLSRFWLESASGPLTAGATVTWHFMVPGAQETVTVTAFEPDRRIAFNWSNGIHVDLAFEEHGKGMTRVAAEAGGFRPDAPLEQIVNTTEGFSIVLCDLKTLLESGTSANLVRDKARLIADNMARRQA